MGVYYRNSKTNGKADKTYYITFKDQNNKTVEMKIGKYSQGIREAYCNQKRIEILTKQRNGEESPLLQSKKKKIFFTLEKIADEYFKNTHVVRSIKSHYKTHIEPFFKDYDIESFSKKDLIKYNDILKTTIGQKTKKLLAPKTINNILNILKAIVNYGLKNELIKNDFTKHIQLNSIDNARERFLTKEEISKLYNYTKNNDNVFLFIKIALTTGARLTTILNIRKKDIDFQHNLLTLKDYKNNSTYKAFLTNELKELLQIRTKSIDLKEKIFSKNPEVKLRRILDIM